MLARILLAVACLVTAGPAWGQSSVPPDSLRGLATSLGKRVNAALGLPDNADTDQLSSVWLELWALEVSTAPYGTSAGGFTFGFDPQLGTFTRSAPTFGPVFAERSLTAGKRKLNLGFNFLQSKYNSLAGQNLTNGDLAVARNVVNPLVAKITERTNLVSKTAVIFANYGVTDDFDVGLAVPWVTVSAEGQISLLTSSGVDLTASQPISVPRTTASGIGDVAVTGKYRIWHEAQGGLSAGVTVRLPSGDTNQVQGLGVTRTLVSAIWSRGGRVAPHANVGYEFWSASVPISHSNDISVKNQLTFAGGVELEAHPTLTVVLDLVGRRLFHGGALGYERIAFPTPVPVSAEVLVPLPHGYNVLSVAPGIKWNIAGNVLVVGNALIAVANNGVRANVIPVLGLDWMF